MKTLAIIGASYLQRPLVERAKQMGLRTICFSWPEGAVCKEICDVFYPVSITEKEEIARICKDERIDGVCTIASDVAAPTVAYVAEQLGLTGNRYESAVRAHDKHLMRAALVAAGVDCPHYIVESRKSKAERSGLELPLIVKPSDRSGSLGVQKITRWEELDEAVQKALDVSIIGEALIEEYIEGREISVEMISCGGVHHALQITDKVTTGAPHFVELAHHQPSDLPAAMQERIFGISRQALDALGLTNGASHSEYKITKEGRIVVMEIGGRMGGDFIGSNLVQLSTGYDFLQGVIEVALGEKIQPEKTKAAYSGVYFLSGVTPEVQFYISHASEYKQIVHSEQTDTEIRPLTCSADRSGYFIYCDAHRRFETLRGKTVMVLGGGRYQLPLIRAAREAGCRVLVLGWPGDYPGYAYASKWYDVDIMDSDAVIRIAKDEAIDGIVGCGSDFILPTIGHVVDALGLPGTGYHSSVVASDKSLMKAAFARTGVRTAIYEQVENKEQTIEAAARIGYPVVLKIVDGSGSKGVVICQDEQALGTAYDEVLPLTHHPYMVVEQFVDGVEFGAQAFVQNGRLQFVMMHGDIVYQGDSGIPVGHYAPALTEYEGLQADAEEQLRRAIEALEIDNCAINADFILHDGKVYVLEIGARAGATCLPELVSECYGVDYYTYLLCGACGLPLPTMQRDQLHPALVYTPYSTKTGTVRRVHQPTCDSIVTCEIYPKVGDEVHAFRTAYDRIGHMVMKGERMEDLLHCFETQIKPFEFVEVTEK